ncbi:hypothetical protein NP554_18710 [Pseudomonas asiatica]|uniref:Uncharacterized protein n=1 Tax=Pseudomonas asiatica TaxID=2219225 RepID=A0A9X4HYK0_9PSED|nr:hypothetical protein [Pseudomonas asiatica]MDD2113810.1 hypothetical protein [Pseudomonas asiatica]
MTMNNFAQLVGYAVMGAGGAMLAMYALYLAWAMLCGLSSGFIRASRVIKAARKGVKRG